MDFTEIWNRHRPAPEKLAQLVLVTRAREKAGSLSQSQALAAETLQFWRAPTEQDLNILARDMSTKMLTTAIKGGTYASLFEVPLPAFESPGIVIPAAINFADELHAELGRAHPAASAVTKTRLYQLAPVLLRSVLQTHTEMLVAGGTASYRLGFMQGGFDEMGCASCISAVASWQSCV